MSFVCSLSPPPPFPNLPPLVDGNPSLVAKRKAATMATASTGTTTAPVPMARASRLVDDDHDADESDVSDLIDSGSVEKGHGGRDPRELLYQQLVLFTSVDVFLLDSFL
jgi:hypothetical protein